VLIQYPINVISFDELERLTAFRCEDGIVSLYLCAQPQSSGKEGQFLSQFREAFNKFCRRTTDPTRLHAAKRERARIEDYLRWRRAVRGSVALYSCQPAGLWEIFDIDIPVPVVFDVGSTARTGILSQVLDKQLEIGRYHQESATDRQANSASERLVMNGKGGRGTLRAGPLSKVV
jgi:hypothetical protein